MFPRKVEKHQEETFSDLAAAQDYAESVNKSTIRYQAFLRKLKSLNIEGRYLDVGAGTGNLAAMILKDSPNIEITALEISPDMLTVGEKLIRDEGLENRVQFVLGDALDKNSLE
jgi:ubiquinone/menaquinone biosynthesis C-methylase UbiE